MSVRYSDAILSIGADDTQATIFVCNDCGAALITSPQTGPITNTHDAWHARHADEEPIHEGRVDEEPARVPHTGDPRLPELLRTRCCKPTEPWVSPDNHDHGHTDCLYMNEAADEIERLRAQIGRLRTQIDKMRPVVVDAVLWRRGLRGSRVGRPVGPIFPTEVALSQTVDAYLAARDNQ